MTRRATSGHAACPWRDLRVRHPDQPRVRPGSGETVSSATCAPPQFRFALLRPVVVRLLRILIEFVARQIDEGDAIDPVIPDVVGIDPGRTIIVQEDLDAFDPASWPAAEVDHAAEMASVLLIHIGADEITAAKIDIPFRSSIEIRAAPPPGGMRAIVLVAIEPVLVVAARVLILLLLRIVLIELLLIGLGWSLRLGHGRKSEHRGGAE